MKNTPLIIAAASGAVLAATLTWLYQTEAGRQTVSQVKNMIKDKFKDLAATEISRQSGVSKDLTRPATDMMVD